MEAYFDSILEHVRHERPLILLLSIVEPDILGQNKFQYHETEIIRNIALKKLHKQRNLKQIIALEIIEKQFSDYTIKLYKKFLSDY